MITNTSFSKSVYGKLLGCGVAWIRRRRTSPSTSHNSQKRRRLIHGTQLSKAIPEHFRTRSKGGYLGEVNGGKFLGLHDSDAVTFS